MCKFVGSCDKVIAITSDQVLFITTTVCGDHKPCPSGIYTTLKQSSAIQ